ncbi:MAG: hypothetical protein JWL79_2099 [Frankiales bacterium]|nr:hypothetical protein [Frankiales bacterium]
MAEDHVAELAANNAILRLPVVPFIGLSAQEAEKRAKQEGRYVRLLTSLDGPRRLDLAFRRVNIVLDGVGVVSAADTG